MATPKNFRQPFGVLNVGMILVTVIYVGMGMMGYWRYGEQIKSSITMNFPIAEMYWFLHVFNNFKKIILIYFSLAQVIIISYSIAIYISYGLQGYVPVQIMWSNYIAKRVEDVNEKKKAFYEYLLRIVCVIVTCKISRIVCIISSLT